MDDANAKQDWLTQSANEQYMYLTTTGRRSGQAHRIEIWFAVHDGGLYLRAGGGARADWVKNLQANPRITVELGNETHAGTAHVVEVGSAEDDLARKLLVTKYAKSENDLTDWGQRSLPVRIEFAADAD